MRHRKARLTLLLVALALAIGCTHAPPTLSPQGVQAFNNTRVIKGLDLIRDVAVDANAQTPPIVSTDTTRKIVTYHRSALLVIHDIPNGWKATVLTGLDETVRGLPAKESQLVAPYVALLKTLIAEVQ